MVPREGLEPPTRGFSVFRLFILTSSTKFYQNPISNIIRDICRNTVLDKSGYKHENLHISWHDYTGITLNFTIEEFLDTVRKLIGNAQNRFG
jgi:hypothetical protein